MPLKKKKRSEAASVASHEDKKHDEAAMPPKKKKRRLAKAATAHGSEEVADSGADAAKIKLGGSKNKKKAKAASSDVPAKNARKPNILVTGTPGVGKTTLCKALAREGATHIEVSKLITEKKLYTEWDDEMNCSVFDEDMVCDALEPMLKAGNCLIDFHSAACFPLEWFDLYVVLRAETNVLWERLEKRSYSEAKIKGNIEAEIFQTCLEEVQETTDGSSTPVWEMPCNTQEEQKAIRLRLQEFLSKGGSSSA
eukprot:TRINITY_DN19309_c0_g4_i1.p1 TRINITY_DN19309_c0_g4~~TRINITY_DN19309_c0_g4_i1.p1  ORF type:complete len:265 (+),score=61.62 TRINITY_DN19309_c0_g4_i1:39-797(+)